MVHLVIGNHRPLDPVARQRSRINGAVPPPAYAADQFERMIAETRPDHVIVKEMEKWAEMRFSPSPSLRLLRFRYPVNAYLQAVRDAGAPAIPRAKASTTAVYRVDFRIWRMDLTPITTEEQWTSP